MRERTVTVPAPVVKLIVEKNRHGETGKIRLAWRPHFAPVNSMTMGTNDYRYGMEAS